MKYLLTLKNGETRDVTILKHPIYRCFPNDNTSAAYYTQDEIAKKYPEIVNTDKVNQEALYLHLSGVGYIADEGNLFIMYKLMRNPIVKLEKIEEDDKKTGDEKTISVSAKDLKTFYDDAYNQTGWSDSSYRLAEFIGIDPSDGV